MTVPLAGKSRASPWKGAGLPGATWLDTCGQVATRSEHKLSLLTTLLLVFLSATCLLSCATSPRWPPERWPLTCADAELSGYTADKSPPINIDGLKTDDPMVRALQGRRPLLKECMKTLHHQDFTAGAVVVQFHTSGTSKVDDICILENNVPSRRTVQCAALVVQETPVPQGVSGTFVIRTVFELQ